MYSKIKRNFYNRVCAYKEQFPYMGSQYNNAILNDHLKRLFCISICSSISKFLLKTGATLVQFDKCDTRHMDIML